MIGRADKAGQHFQRFMLAFWEVHPEAFGELDTEVLALWLEADPELSFIRQRNAFEVNDWHTMSQWLLPEVSSEQLAVLSPKELRVILGTREGFLNLLRWLDRYNLAQSVYGTSFLVSVLLAWSRDSERREARRLFVTLREHDLPKLARGKKPVPPEFTARYMDEEQYSSAKEKHFGAVEKYIDQLREWQERKHPSLDEIVFGRKRVSKANPLHYEWAARYHCLETSPGDICKIYATQAPADESQMRVEIFRTLDDCLVIPRTGKPGAKIEQLLQSS